MNNTSAIPRERFDAFYNSLQGELSKLSAENSTLRQELETMTGRYAAAMQYRGISMPDELLATLQAAADGANKPLPLFVIELLSYAVREREGRASMLPVEQSVYAKFVSLAEARGISLDAVSATEEVSEWLAQGFANYRF